MNIHKVLDEEQTISDFYNILLETMNMILSARSRLIILANWHVYDCVRNLHKGFFAANQLAFFLLIGNSSPFSPTNVLPERFQQKKSCQKYGKKKKHVQKFSSRNPHLPREFPIRIINFPRHRRLQTRRIALPTMFQASVISG